MRSPGSGWRQGTSSDPLRVPMFAAPLNRLLVRFRSNLLEHTTDVNRQVVTFFDSIRPQICAQILEARIGQHDAHGLTFVFGSQELQSRGDNGS